MAKVKLEDLFEIDYDETDPHWFRIIAKPEFAKHKIRIVSQQAQVDFHHVFKGEEEISIRPADHPNFPKKFNSIYLTSYDKKPEQGYFGQGEIYIEIKEVKEAKKQCK